MATGCGTLAPCSGIPRAAAWMRSVATSLYTDVEEQGSHSALSELASYFAPAITVFVTDDGVV
ncbi:hypothetical protein CEQ28_000070 [Hafnia alvei]|nr:hypothetical protein CEQ28_000070 [Hafnia alvei]